MNKLVFPNGGVPLQADDFRFMQDALQEAVNAVLKEFAGIYHNVIVYGCEHTITGSTMSITEGYVMIEGELCYCPSQSAPYSTSNELYLHNYYDSTGTEISAAGTTIQTYEVRRVKLGINPNQVIDPIVVLENRRLGRGIVENIAPYVRTFNQNISFLNSCTNNNLIVANEFDRITFEGGINCNLQINSGWTDILQLPNNLNPSRPIYNSIVVHESGSYYNALSRIETNGKLRVQAATGQTIENVYLDGITYLV